MNTPEHSPATSSVLNFM